MITSYTDHSISQSTIHIIHTTHTQRDLFLPCAKAGTKEHAVALRDFLITLAVAAVAGRRKYGEREQGLEW
jgi:hypothetical protein